MNPVESTGKQIDEPGVWVPNIRFRLEEDL
jgi:hypothetical protein